MASSGFSANKMELGFRRWKKRFLKAITLRDELLRHLLCEVYATFLLSSIVHAAVAQDVLSRTGSNLNVALAVGFAVAFAVYSGFGVSGGHVNLALSVGIAVIGEFPWRKVPFYFVAQLIGGFLGASVVYLIYSDALNEFDGGTRQAFGPNGTAGIFATFPQPYLSLTTGFLEQVFNTGLLLAIIGAIMDRRNSPPPLSSAPFFFGFIVFTILLTFGLNAGAPLNPSLDLSGRLLLAAAGYGPGVWKPGGVHWWWIPIVGPALGAALGSWAYQIAIKIHHPPLPATSPTIKVDHNENRELSGGHEHPTKELDLKPKRLNRIPSHNSHKNHVTTVTTTNTTGNKSNMILGLELDHRMSSPFTDDSEGEAVDEASRPLSVDVYCHALPNNDSTDDDYL